MPPSTLFESAFDRSRQNDLAAFKAAQLKAGGGSDPFAPGESGDLLVGCFEYMNGRLVPEALRAVAASVPHGSMSITLKRPSVDERQRGILDTLVSDDPMFWVSAALAAGIPVIRYIVEVAPRRLAILW